MPAIVPGYRASHGCIRLPYSFARKLYGLTKIGNRVIVSYDDPEPIAFESPKLFEPLPLDDATAMTVRASKPQLIAVNDQGDDNATSDAPQGCATSHWHFAGASQGGRGDAEGPSATADDAERSRSDHAGEARSCAGRREDGGDCVRGGRRQGKIDWKDFDDASQKFEAARRTIEPLRAAVKSAEARQKDAMRAFEDLHVERRAKLRARDREPMQRRTMPGTDRESDLEDALLDLTIEADKRGPRRPRTR